MHICLQICLAVVCFPCICLRCCQKPRHTLHNPEYILKRRQRDAPRPLPPLRKRALTLPLPSRKHGLHLWTEQRTEHQLQTGLFKLPPEVRRLIYTEVLGGKVMHILRKHRKLGHINCRATETEAGICRDIKCWGLSTDLGIWVGRDKESTDGGLLPLLQTCRRVYTEAIDILYSRNVFDFNHLDSILQLAYTILPQRLNAIHSLRLNWCFSFGFYSHFGSMTPPDDEATWEEVWRIIAHMYRLRDVRVVILASYTDMSPAKEAEILKPLKGVKGLRSFEVVVPWPATEGSGDLTNMPFQVKRLGESEEGNS